MSHIDSSSKNSTSTARSNLIEVATVFLKLGTIAFGGPAAHIAMMDDELVKRRKWIDRDRFLDLLGASNLIPGPNSTELAIHLGYQRAGWLGLILAGTCFILPAMVIVLLIAMMYVKYGTLPQVSGILYGIKPVIVAIVLQALWGLFKSAVKNVQTAIVGIGVVALSLAGFHEIALLAIAGLAVMLYNNRSRLGGKHASFIFPIPWLLSPNSFPWSRHKIGPGMYLADSVTHITTSTVTGTLSLSALFLTFLKIGSVLYGSGYVLLAFLQADFVERLHVLTSQQLLDAVAIGQFTPGPVFTTATFIGYIIGGTAGALVGTVAIFLPAFLFVAITYRWIGKLRQSPWIAAFLDGVNVASLALMALVSWQLGLTAIVDGVTAVLAMLTLFLTIRYKINSAWLVLAGGIFGWLVRSL